MLLIFRTRGVRVFCWWRVFPDQFVDWLLHLKLSSESEETFQERLCIDNFLLITCRLIPKIGCLLVFLHWFGTKGAYWHHLLGGWLTQFFFCVVIQKIVLYLLYCCDKKLYCTYCTCCAQLSSVVSVREQKIKYNLSYNYICMKFFFKVLCVY